MKNGFSFLNTATAIVAYGLLPFSITSSQAHAQVDVPDSLTLFDFEGELDSESVVGNDAVASLTGENDKSLLVKTGIRSGAPGVTIKNLNGHWDLNPYFHVKLDISNAGKRPAQIIFKVGDPKDGMSDGNSLRLGSWRDKDCRQ